MFRLIFLLIFLRLLMFFFFFQAEDGIRDIGVTGVQTCALPDAEGDIAHRLDGRPRQLERFAQSPDVDARYIRRSVERHPGHILRFQLLRFQPGYAFRAASTKPGLTTSAMVSGLIPVISRNHTFPPRAKPSASM